MSEVKKLYLCIGFTEEEIKELWELSKEKGFSSPSALIRHLLISYLHSVN